MFLLLNTRTHSFCPTRGHLAHTTLVEIVSIYLTLVEIFPIYLNFLSGLVTCLVYIHEPTKYILTNMNVPLIMLSFSHQN
jgi:hypothetical protein